MDDKTRDLDPVTGNEFFIGYLPAMPEGVARRVRLVVAAVLVAAGASALTLGAFQRHAPESSWGDEVVTLKGVVVLDPYPRLVVVEQAGGGANAGGGRRESVLLVAQGKHGLNNPADYCGGDAALERVNASFNAELRQTLRDLSDAQATVEVRGTVLARVGPGGVPRRMLEVSSSAVELKRSRDLGVTGEQSSAALGSVERLGEVELVGEIVDPKCYYGAMQPGSGQTHKACAVRCISGGIAPVLVAMDARGDWSPYLLTDKEGRPCNAALMGVVGEPVSVKGTLTRRGEALMLAIDPALVERR